MAELGKVCPPSGRTARAIVCPLKRPVARYILDRAAVGWGGSASSQQHDRIDTATAWFFVRELFKSKPAARARVAPLEASARLVGAKVGIGNTRIIEGSIRRHLARGWLVREWLNGTTPRYSLDYVALEAERGNFVDVTPAEADSIQFGDRVEQRVQARIILAADANDTAGRGEADLRLDDFGASRGSIEAALARLEACGTVEVTRSRLAGNRYARTWSGAFTNDRIARRAELVQAARAHQPGRPRTKPPVRNRTTPRCEIEQTPGSKSNDIEEQWNLQGKNHHPAHDAEPVVVSLESAHHEPPPRPEAQRIEAKVRTAGVRMPKLPAGAVAGIIDAGHEHVLDAVIAKSRDDGSGPGLVVAYLKAVAAGTPWESPRVHEPEPVPEYFTPFSDEEVA